MNKFLSFAIASILILAAVVSGVLYKGEFEKNQLLRTENLKTATEVQAELKKSREDMQKERDKNLEDKQKLLDQVTQAAQEKEKAVNEMETLKKRFSNEKELSSLANDDLNKLQAEVATMEKESRKNIAQLQETFKNRQQAYETRILSLEAQLEKIKSRTASEGERYHYNLGVVYTQNKDFDSAVAEFKKALEYNPKNAQAAYNLGIIFDDYFKDKENARHYYRIFLELKPASDDADSVREWLANLDKK